MSEQRGNDDDATYHFDSIETATDYATQYGGALTGVQSDSHSGLLRLRAVNGQWYSSRVRLGETPRQTRERVRIEMAVARENRRANAAG